MPLKKESIHDLTADEKESIHDLTADDKKAFEDFTDWVNDPATCIKDEDSGKVKYLDEQVDSMLRQFKSQGNVGQRIIETAQIYKEIASLYHQAGETKKNFTYLFMSSELCRKRRIEGGSFETEIISYLDLLKPVTRLFYENEHEPKKAKNWFKESLNLMMFYEKSLNLAKIEGELGENKIQSYNDRNHRINKEILLKFAKTLFYSFKEEKAGLRYVAREFYRYITSSMDDIEKSIQKSVDLKGNTGHLLFVLRDKLEFYSQAIEKLINAVKHDNEDLAINAVSKLYTFSDSSKDYAFLYRPSPNLRKIINKNSKAAYNHADNLFKELVSFYKSSERYELAKKTIDRYYEDTEASLQKLDKEFNADDISNVRWNSFRYFIIDHFIEVAGERFDFYKEQNYNMRDNDIRTWYKFTKYIVDNLDKIYKEKVGEKREFYLRLFEKASGALSEMQNG